MHSLTSTLRDRREAGSLLGRKLAHLGGPASLVLALPRGGVPVGFEIAQQLLSPLDVLIVRKIGAPDNPEYGLGAMVEDGSYFLDEPRVREAGYTLSELAPIVRRERAETERRARVYRSARPRLDRHGQTVIIVDDGAATGGTLFAALRAVRNEGVARAVVALGVAPADTCTRLERAADELAVLLRPANFYAVGQFYEQFDPVEEEEVLELLRRANPSRKDPPSPVHEPADPRR